MTQIGDKTTITDVVNSINLGPTGSLQFQFAKLQLAMSMMCKESAMDYMANIQDSQEEQKRIAAMLQEVRNVQENGSNTTVALRDNHVLVSYDTAKYMVDNGLAVTGDIETYTDLLVLDQEDATIKNAVMMDTISKNGLQVPKDKLDVLVTSLQAQLDQVGSNTQQLMIYVQDFMGQYDSYLQGANSVIQSANQTLMQLARTS